MTHQQQAPEQQNQSDRSLGYRGLYRKAAIPACGVSLEDLRRLYAQLNEKTGEALDRYLDTVKPPPAQDPAQVEELKKEARQIGGLTVIVNGSKGEQIVYTSVEALADEKIPHRISFILFDSASALKTLFNVSLPNRFRLNLDFTEPPSFHAYNPWDQPTPNNSYLEVIGADTTWATAVYETILSFFRERKRNRRWLHSQNTFNILNWTVGFPGALWLTYRLESVFHSAFQSLHTVLRGALYVYLVILGLLAFRLIIAGFRWIFPLLELEGARSWKVRGFLGLILGSFLLMLLYDVFKGIFWN